MHFRRFSRLIAILVSVACLSASGPLTAADFHVAPDGTPEGDGSPDRPWDLATALSHPAAVRPGDTIRLRGGTYRGAFTSRLAGTAEQPIVVRSAPGEWAVLDAFSSGASGSTLSVQGAFTWFRDFEITNSSPRRVTQAGGSHPEDLTLNGSVDVYSGAGHKLINLVVHHCAGGPSAWKGAVDTEVYGCLVFNNGWDAPDRGHGHAFYWQNEEGTKRLVDNVFFNQFSHGVHFYGSSRASLSNFHIEGNIAFNNGALSKRTGHTRNLLVGGGRVADNVTVLDNVTFFSRGGSNILGYGRGAEGLTVRGNYFASGEGSTALEVNAAGLTLERNVFIGRTGGFRPEDHAENEFLPAGQPDPAETAIRVFVRPNRYEAGRAHVAVFNWSRQDTAVVDLSAAGLKRGERYEIRDVQDWFGEPVLRVEYDGEPVTLPMAGMKAAPPLGDAPTTPPHTGPEFAAFVVRRVE